MKFLTKKCKFLCQQLFKSIVSNLKLKNFLTFSKLKQARIKIIVTVLWTMGTANHPRSPKGDIKMITSLPANRFRNNII